MKENRTTDKFHIMLGSILRQHRVDAEMSQEELAGLLHVHPNTVSNYERGLGPMPVRLLLQICEVLDLRPARVLLDVGDQAEKINGR